MLIILCLIPLIGITFLSVILGSEFVSASITDKLVETLTVNGTVPEWLNVEGLSTTHTFNVGGLEGAIAIIIVIAVISVGIGINILGSGLAETTVKLITSALAYTGLWTVLSVLAIPLIFQIEIFGLLIYISLTIGYTIGVIQQITGN